MTCNCGQNLTMEQNSITLHYIQMPRHIQHVMVLVTNTSSMEKHHNSAYSEVQTTTIITSGLTFASIRCAGRHAHAQHTQNL
jgi:hypothetical protein